MAAAWMRPPVRLSVHALPCTRQPAKRRDDRPARKRLPEAGRVSQPRSGAGVPARAFCPPRPPRPRTWHITARTPPCAPSHAAPQKKSARADALRARLRTWSLHQRRRAAPAKACGTRRRSGP
eukprot:scaffold2886_cov137-Isochrysis_galbana.AAC.2